MDKLLCGKKGIILSNSEDISPASIPNPNLNSNIQRQLMEGRGRGQGHYIFSGTQSFQEHIATCEIYRQVAQMETESE